MSSVFASLGVRTNGEGFGRLTEASLLPEGENVSGTEQKCSPIKFPKRSRRGEVFHYNKIQKKTGLNFFSETYYLYGND
jgi:hypothetical protein